MQLSYVITGAHWNANYDVRVTSGENTIELTYYGVITNNSSDDWLNVRTSTSLFNNVHYLINSKYRPTSFYRLPSPQLVVLPLLCSPSSSTSPTTILK